MSERHGRRSCSDAAALAIMARFNALRIANGEQTNDRQAAREAIIALGLRNEFVADGAIEDRLRGKFRKHRQALLNAAAAELELIPINSQAPLADMRYGSDSRNENDEHAPQSSAR